MAEGSHYTRSPRPFGRAGSVEAKIDGWSRVTLEGSTLAGGPAGSAEDGAGMWRGRAGG